MADPTPADALREYAQRFRNLRTDANRGHYPEQTRHRAPHKPLLLFSVMDLLAEGAATENFFEPGPELVELFALYWSRVMPRERRGILAYPFFHLRSEGFWHLVPIPGQEAVLARTSTVSSIPQLRRLALGARLDEPLFGLLLDPKARETLRGVLLDQYFTQEARGLLLGQSRVNVKAYRYSEALLESARAGMACEAVPEEEAEAPVRDQGFRRAVVTAYEHRCGFCGIRMVTPDGHTAVEAAHIVPWSVSHNDSPRNGIGLCRLCHWTFDEGLLTLSGDYAIHTSPQLSQEPNLPAHLASLAGRRLLGPSDQRLWPNPAAVEWHRRQAFRGR